MTNTPQQLELFGSPTALTAIPPCGRGLGPCLVFAEAGNWRCTTCGCIAPRKSPRTIFDGYLEAQTRFIEFLPQQDLLPDNSGKWPTIRKDQAS